jgi:hypothetical protein
MNAYVIDDYPEDISKYKKSGDVSNLLDLKGAFTKYKNPNLRKNEKNAWTMAVKEKYKNYPYLYAYSKQEIMKFLLLI